MDIQPQAEDRFSATTSGSRRLPVGLLLVGAAVIALGVYFYLQRDVSEPGTAPPIASAVIPPPTPVVEQEIPAAPDIPQRVVEVAPDPQELAPVVPAVKLEDSDELIREAFKSAGDPSLFAGAMSADSLVERSVSLVDGLSRGLVLRKMLPVKAPGKPFAVVQTDGQLYLDPASYHRYDSYADAVVDFDAAQLTDTFHEYRFLFEQAYAGLGYPAEDFDNTLIRSLDRILATPEIREPIAVKQVEAIYKFSDPSLEELTSLQKHLLRMGPDNTIKIKQQAAALRRALLQ
ncbi:MAG: DUF3014 domain-containing protein [Halioglobus sp.]